MGGKTAFGFTGRGASRENLILSARGQESSSASCLYLRDIRATLHDRYRKRVRLVLPTTRSGAPFHDRSLAVYPPCPRQISIPLHTTGCDNAD